MNFQDHTKKDRAEILRMIRNENPDFDSPFFRLDITATKGDPEINPGVWAKIARDVEDGTTQGDIALNGGNFFWSITFQD